MRPLFLLLSCCLAWTLHTTSAQAQSKELPILAWASLPAGEESNLSRYQELRDCGFNYNFSHIYSFEAAIKALDLCQQVGMKSIFMCPELKTDPEETVAKVRNHPALGGYFLRDEPNEKEFKELGKWAARVREADSTHFCYLNLFPMWVMKEKQYKKYLRSFNEKVDLPILSFDYYPITRKNGEDIINATWYENLELIAAEARRTGKPFWAFALSTAHDDYPVPTLAHLRLQMYSNLAYGAQGLQYFTYWNPSTERWDFHAAPIGLSRKRSHVYELVREMNQELQRRAFVFVGAEMQSVHHLGDNIPSGTRPLVELPPHFTELSTQGQNALVARLINGEHHYVVIVNTSPTQPLAMRIATDDNVMRIRKDGTSVQALLYDPDYLLDAGAAEIFETP